MASFEFESAWKPGTRFLRPSPSGFLYIKMADKSSFTVLSRCLDHLCPKLAPQIIPAGDINARQIIESIQHEVMKSKKSTTKASFCELCGRATRDEDGEDYGNVLARSILKWDIDLVKKCLKVLRLQLACQDCQVLLNLKKLLTFFASPEEEFDQAKLYLLACHFSQINGHNSESEEGDITLLQQAVAAAHALHVLTKNVSDITVQGPDEQPISLDVCHEVAMSLLEKECAALPQSTKKSKKTKRGKEATGAGQIDAVNALDGGNNETPKKSKKAKRNRNLENGHHPVESNNEDTIELDTVQVSKTVTPDTKPKKNRHVLSEKKPKKVSSAVKQKNRKRRRSAPGMTRGLGHED